MRKLLATLAVFALCGPTAHAAFPGQNGKIAFERTVGDRDCIWTVNVEGSAEAPVLPCDDTFGEYDPEWSPSGQRIAYRGNAGQIDTVAPDGSGLLPFAYDSGVGNNGFSWSPDGTQFAVAYWVCNPECKTKLVRAPSGGGSETVVSESTTDFFRGVDWSPDGQRIGYYGTLSQTLATVHPDGSGTAPIGDYEHMSWSPDGRKLAVHAFDEGNWDVYVIDVDGSNQTQLTTDPGSDSAPVWSPDGTKIAFVSNRDGNSEIYVMDADGGDQTRVTNDARPDFSPDWQPIPVNAYPRPKGATPLQVSLVPAYPQCTSPNRTHGPPLASGSCNPPAQTSDELTVGTADSNARPTKSRGLVRYDVLPGAPATPADEADVRLTVELSDVYEQGSLADYAGELRAPTSLRITDKLNTPHPGGPGAGTVSDVDLEATVPCAATPDPAEGAGCNLTTTFDSLVPGTVTETRRSVWELGQAELLDASGDPFMRQGLFVP